MKDKKWIPDISALFSAGFKQRAFENEYAKNNPDVDLDELSDYSTIASIRGVVKPAFQMAYTEDIIRRNPFEFRLDIIPNNTQKRVALSPKQQ